MLGADVLHDEFYVWANDYYFYSRSLFVCYLLLSNPINATKSTNALATLLT